MKIDYAILHWNRPYFADIHLSLAKRYFPFINNFILLDDGSDHRCLDILRPKFDKVLISENNVNLWKSGSVGSLLYNFSKSFDGDLLIFSEDDFLPCPLYFDDSETEENMIPPDCVFPESNQTDFTKIIEIVEKSNVFLQLAKSNYGWKKLKTIEFCKNMLKVLPENNKRIYSNWPWMMRKKLIFSLFKNVSGLPIWQIESMVNSNILNIDHKSLCLESKQYVHAGFICSTRIDKFENIGKFNFSRRRSASSFFKEKIYSLDDLREKLLNNYLDGARIEDSILINQGLYSGLKSFINS